MEASGAGKPLDLSGHLDESIKDKPQNGGPDDVERREQVAAAQMKQIGEAVKTGPSPSTVADPTGSVLLTELQELKADIRSLNVIVTALLVGAASVALGFYLMRKGGNEIGNG